MGDRRPRPAISVLIPAFERERELRLCLEGFREQKLPADEFEVVVVDDGSSCDLESAVSSIPGLRVEFRRAAHGGPSVARNIALEIARAPLLLLYDDDLRPLPELLEHCLDFHRRNPADSAASLLYFTYDLAANPNAFEKWAFPRLYPFPAEAGIYNWGYFWSGSLTCKKNLLTGFPFNARYRAIEDAELGFRLSRGCPLSIEFEPQPRGVLLRRLTFDDVYRRQLRTGYYRYLLAEESGKRVRYPHPACQNPEQYLVDRALLETAKALAALDDSTASPVAQSLWTRAENHAMATGWLAAKRAVPPDELQSL